MRRDFMSLRPRRFHQGRQLRIAEAIADSGLIDQAGVRRALDNMRRPSKAARR
jgi:hypothetical protein